MNNYGSVWFVNSENKFFVHCRFLIIISLFVVRKLVPQLCTFLLDNKDHKQCDLFIFSDCNTGMHFLSLVMEFVILKMSTRITQLKTEACSSFACIFLCCGCHVTEGDDDYVRACVTCTAPQRGLYLEFISPNILNKNVPLDFGNL